MDDEIRLTPNGRLRLTDADDAKPSPFHGAFSEGDGVGLLALAAARQGEPLPPTLTYWQDFARQYMTSLCRSGLSEESVGWEPIDAEPGWFHQKIIQAPPGIGMEYLTLDTLRSIWARLDDRARQDSGAMGESAAAWVRKKHPLWELVGRVTFHLAENKKDEARPFAFIATYTHGISASSRLQHIPLSRALQEHAGNRRALENLLTPVQKAAESSALAQRLLETRHIFQPLAWTPPQALAFINEIPVLEEAGVAVKVPNWWKGRRPNRAQVRVTLDSNRAGLGVETLLNFSVDLALGGEKLTAAEVRTLLKSAGPLVQLKGQWIEVDREKIEQLKQHWEQVKELHRDGVSFLEGMRLLSGFGSEALAGPAPVGQIHDWSQVSAGDHLRTLLRQMRDASAAAPCNTGSALKATLRPYQQEGLNWLWFLRNMGLGACLADDMGLGKTIQIIALMLVAKKAKPKKLQPNLLVVPASLLGNWNSELARFAPGLTAFTAHASSASPDEMREIERDAEAFFAPYDVVITTYGRLKRSESIRNRQWQIVVLDEAQAIKNARTAQTKAVKELKGQTRIVLSGTPIENHLSDLWSLFDFINPGLLGSPADFKRALGTMQQKGQLADYTPLRNLVAPYILRRMKTDRAIVPDLPDKTEMTTFCTLTKHQAAIYKKSVETMAKALEESDGIQRRGIVLSYLQRFKQICNHPAQWLGDGDYDDKRSGKFQRLAALCEEMASRQEKVLVFTQFREMTDPLHEILAGVFKRSGLVLHGGTTIKSRQKMVDQFQDDDGPPFFILSLKAGGTGLNLTAAARVVHFDRWWNPAVEDQATDRAFRIGQKQNVFVHKFVCQGTIEERIHEMIEGKRSLAKEVLGQGAESALTEMSDEELLSFVALDINKAVN